MALSPDSRWLAALSCEGGGEEPFGACDVVLWDTRHHHRMRRLPMPKGGLAYTEFVGRLPLAFSPDSRTLALVGWNRSKRCKHYYHPVDAQQIHRCWTARDEETVRLQIARWDVPTGKALAPIPVPARLPPRGLSFDAAGDHAIISLQEYDDDKSRPRVITLALATGKVIRSRQLAVGTRTVHRPGGGYAERTDPGKHTLEIVDLATGKRRALLSHLPSGAFSVGYSEWAAKVAVVTRRHLTIYTLPSSAATSSAPLDLRSLPHFRIHATVNHTPKDSEDNSPGDRCERSFQGWAGFAPGGRTFVAQMAPGGPAYKARTHRLFAIIDVPKKARRTRRVEEYYNEPQVFAPDGSSVLVDCSYCGGPHGSCLGAIERRALPSGRLLQRLEGNDGVPGTLRISPDGRRVAVGSQNAHWYGFPVRELDLASGRVVDRYRINHHCNLSPDWAAEMSYSEPRGPRCLQRPQEDETAPPWLREPTQDLTDALEKRFPCLDKECSVSARSPNSRWLAIGCDTGHLVIWRWGRWTRPAHILKRPGEVDAVAFSPDSEQVVVASEVHRRHKGGGHRVLLATYRLPHGRPLGSVLLESRTRDEDPSLSCLAHTAGSLAVSPQGVRAVGLADGRIVLHHPRRGIVADLQAHEGVITALRWAKGGRLLVSGAKDWRVRAWRVALED